MQVEQVGKTRLIVEYNEAKPYRSEVREKLGIEQEHTKSPLKGPRAMAVPNEPNWLKVDRSMKIEPEPGFQQS